MAGEWGPLEALTGDWASDKGGLDAAFSHSRGEVLQTPYLEKLSLKAFGPVDNGNQHLYGLDYKSAGEIKCLAEHASTLSYDVKITINDDDSWSYDETTMLEMDEFPEPFAHTDRNALRRAS